MKWPLAANVVICAAAAGCAQSPSVSERPGGGAKGQADAAVAPRDGAALDSKIPQPDIDGPSSEDGSEDMSSGDAGASEAAPNDAPAVRTLDAGIAEAGGDSTDDAAAEAARDAASDNAAEAGRDAGICANGVTSISNIGTNDFHIYFRITTSQKGWVALVNQRALCYTGVYWDIRQCAAGAFCKVDNGLFVETEGAANGSYQNVRSAGTINDGNPHDIEVARVAGLLKIRIDGASSGTGSSSASLGAMAAVRIGTDACAMAVPPTADFAAGTTLSNLCITSP
jgi:hypothetical protein